MAISRNQLVKELEPGLNALFGLEYKTAKDHGPKTKEQGPTTTSVHQDLPKHLPQRTLPNNSLSKSSHAPFPLYLSMCHIS